MAKSTGFETSLETGVEEPSWWRGGMAPELP